MVVLLNLASKSRGSLCLGDSTCSHLSMISPVLARWALGKRWSTFCRNYDSPVLSCQWPRNFTAWAQSRSICLLRCSSSAVDEHRRGLVVGGTFSACINTRWNWSCWLRRWLSWDDHTSTGHIHWSGCIDRRSLCISRVAARPLLVIGLLESIVLLVCIFNLLFEVIHGRNCILIYDRPRFVQRRVRLLFTVPAIRLQQVLGNGGLGC